MAGQQRRDELGLDRFDRKVSCAEVLVELWARCWWGRMVKVAANRLKDRDAAEDIAQEAFMKALSIARSDPSAVEAVRDPCCWLVAITRKLASGVLRTERRRRRLRRENASEIGGQRRPRFGSFFFVWLSRDAVRRRPRPKLPAHAPRATAGSNSNTSHVSPTRTTPVFCRQK